MAYVSLYRKWRPQTFSDVTGQHHIVRTLENSLRTGKISHAYLFAGPRGTGKTTIARLMAKGLNCENGPSSDPCDKCNECVSIKNGSSLNVIEIDGASNRGIEEIRELREQVRYAPVNARFKVYIIDEVHMLTTEAFNALLKTLEEPPAHVVFVFATTDPHKIPATIVSRCQRYDFKRFSNAELCARLKTVLEGEGVSAEEGIFEVIAEHAEGGMRDALGLLEQCLAYSDSLTHEVVGEVLGIVTQQEIEVFVQALVTNDSIQALKLINQVYDNGKDLLQFTKDVLQYLRRMLLTSESGSEKQLLRLIRDLSECARDMRYAIDPKIPLELMAIGTDNSLAEIDELSDKIAKLQSQLQKVESRQTVGEREHSPEVEERKPTILRMSDSDEAKLAQIKDNWEGFLLTLRNERLIQPEAFLREGTPITVNDDTLVVGFPKERGFHKASIEQPKHKEPSERVLSRYFGATMRLSCAIMEDNPPENKAGLDAPKRKRRKAVEENVVQEGKTDGNANDEQLDEAVTAALRLFGGKIIKVKDNT